MHDAVVVGGGPAGSSAALWLARYRRSVLVVDSGEHRNRWVEQAHGYLGSDPMDPSHFLDIAHEELGRYPEVELRSGRADAARREDDGTFTVEIDGELLSTKRVVLATGVRDVFPEVDHFFEHYGASVFHCPTCDGYEARGRAVVAFGWSEQVVGFALTLLGWAGSVTVVTDGRRFEGDDRHREQLAAQGVRLLEDDALELLGSRGDLRGVRMRSGDVLPCRLAFFTIAHEPASDLDLQLGCAREGDGCTVVDEHGATTVPGVYAAGDMTPGLQLVQVAAAKGTVAGVACAQSLRGEGGIRPGWEHEVPGYVGPMTEYRDAERPGAERLGQIEGEIDEIRNRVADQQGENEPRFIQEGELSEDEPVDDTIAPPG